MSFRVDLSTLVSVGAIFAAIVAFWQFRQQRKEIAVQEGKSKEQQATLQKKVEEAVRKIEKLEDRAHCTDIDISEIKRDIKYIAEIVGELKELYQAQAKERQ